MSNQQLATAAANVLAGETLKISVTFPATGDDALDAISGCLAVIDHLRCNEPGGAPSPWSQIGNAQVVHVFEYLLARYKELAKKDEEQKDKFNPSALQQALARHAQAAPPPAPYPYPQHYTTSTGPTTGGKMMNPWAPEPPKIGDFISGHDADILGNPLP